MSIDLLKQMLKTALQAKAEMLFIASGEPSATETNSTRTELQFPPPSAEQVSEIIKAIAPTALNDLAASGKSQGKLNLGPAGAAQFIVHKNSANAPSLTLFLPPNGQTKATLYWEKLSAGSIQAPTQNSAAATDNQSHLPPEAFSAVNAAKAKAGHKNPSPSAPDPHQQMTQNPNQDFATNPRHALPANGTNEPQSAADPASAAAIELEYAAYAKGEQTISEGQNEIDRFLKEMIKRKASDLHLTGGQPVCVRADGDIERLPDTMLTPEYMKQLLEPIFPARNKSEFLNSNDTDFAYEISNVGRFRVNIFRDKNGIGAVLRHIPSQILTAQQLNLSAAITNFCKLNKGLVLVTGPTGSGKSTTLAAMIDLINKSRNDHILTIEDPIEFVHQQHKSLVNQREVHKHTTSFARALKAALREDPDIVLIGEMRDLETISIAIETAETGHLVFGTLHTTTAVSTVDRIIQQFPAERQEQIRMMLAGGLRGVVAQTLLKKIGGGRVAAHEILVVNDAVSAMIREGKNHMIPNHMQTQKGDGNQLLNEALLNLVTANTVAAADAYSKSVDKSTFAEMLKRKGIDTSAFEMKKSA